MNPNKLHEMTPEDMYPEFHEMTREQLTQEWALADVENDDERSTAAQNAIQEGLVGLDVSDKYKDMILDDVIAEKDDLEKIFVWASMINKKRLADELAEKSRDELIKDWAEADVNGDSEFAKAAVNELCKRVMSMKNVDDRERARMLSAQAEKMAKIKFTLEEKAPIEPEKTEEVTEPTVVLEKSADKLDAMTDSQILNMSAEELKGLSEEDRQKWQRRAAEAALTGGRAEKFEKRREKTGSFIGRIATKRAARKAEQSTQEEPKKPAEEVRTFAQVMKEAKEAAGEKVEPEVKKEQPPEPKPTFRGFLADMARDYKKAAKNQSEANKTRKATKK